MEIEPSSVQNIKDILAKSGSTLSEVMAQMAEKPEHRTGSRIAKVISWTLPKKAASKEEKATLDSLSSVLGSTVVPRQPRKLSKKEVDVLAKETRTIREAQDILLGRYEYVRTFVFDTLTFEMEAQGLEDPEFQPGALISQEEGMILRRGINGGKPQLDEKLLKMNVSDDIWERITEVQVTFTATVDPLEAKTLGPFEMEPFLTRTDVEVVSEEKLVEAVRVGWISVETLAECVTLTEKKPTFNPAVIK